LIESIPAERHILSGIMEKCTRLNIPTQAILELTYRCNLRCVHCYVDVDSHDELTLEEWEKVIDQLKSAGVLSLLITGGEITVREDYMEILEYIRRSGFFISLSTNATTLNTETAHDIAKLKPFLVNVSLYGASAASHEAVTRVAGSFERTIEGIKALVACGNKTMIHTIVMKSNVNELEQIKSLGASLGADVDIDIAITPTKTGAGFPFEYEPTPEEIVNSGWRPDNSVGQLRVDQKLCKAGRSTLSVAPNGDVFPCTLFPLKLGNLKEESFEKIWSLEPRAELRYLRSMRRNDLYACSGCELSVYCHRCPGIAYLESGRLDGPSSSACRQAEMRRRLNQAAEVES
jgi:radical SAM protein with 4Fe4S-binding SPASM domain